MKKIGEGFSATVYSDGEYAYKKYHEGYSLENMKFEIQVQNEIFKNTDLQVAEYELSNNQIKMTLFSGRNLADRIIKDNYIEGFQDFIRLQLETFRYSDLQLADSYKTFEYQINNTNEDELLKKKALESLYSIKKTYQLCHFDYHPENIVYHNDVPHIIDWTNAKLGNPVMDIASTYIILLLFAKDYAELYLNTMLEYGFDKIKIKNAMPVMAFIRFRETKEEDLRTQLKNIILKTK